MTTRPRPASAVPASSGQPRPARVAPGSSASASSLADTAGAELDAMLAEADWALARGYPGERRGRQPVHTVYVPADTFRPGLVPDWGRRALKALEARAPDATQFGVAMGVPPVLAADVRSRVLVKLIEEPVEDLRLDFEDGYHPRADDRRPGDADAAEDDHRPDNSRAAEDDRRPGDSRAAEGDRRLGDADAAEDADARAAGSAPPFSGVRCKSLEPATRRRAIRTLDLFLASLLSRGPLPAGFVVTLPKVTSADQVAAMAHLCDRLERAHSLTAGQLVFEVQVETPQLILGADGTAVVARCVRAGAGRLTGLHYGTYDYSASLGIAAAYQSMDHPAADHARAVMQVAAAGTGVRLSDGSSNVLPEGSQEEVVAAWRLHSHLVRRSLEQGFYQGWDLHPAQLASRYAATYAFFREGLAVTCARLRSYLGSSRQGLLEEPATARALAGYLARGLDCGAISAQEVADLAGLDRAGLAALA